MKDATEIQPKLAIAITGSNLTAITAELIAKLGIYQQVVAITRRDTQTSLPVLFNGDEWGKKLKKLNPLTAKKLIRDFQDEITARTGGEPYDCILHHTKDAFSQLLAEHPLCRKFYYLEEGATALTGGTFGRLKDNKLKRLLWNAKSPIFYSGRINKYRSFFDTTAPNYGGVFALSKDAFKNFPGRIQLPADAITTNLPLPAEVIVFLDSQYFLGNCTEEAYRQALISSLADLLTSPASVAVKFHPSENLTERKQRFIRAISDISHVSSLIELPKDFMAERMDFNPTARILVGTSAIGFFLGTRGFSTFSFAGRVALTSPKYALVLKQMPAGYLKVCLPL